MNLSTQAFNFGQGNLSHGTVLIGNYTNAGLLEDSVTIMQNDNAINSGVWDSSPTSDGGAISSSKFSGSNWLIRTNAYGDTLWIKSFDDWLLPYSKLKTLVQ